MARLDCTKLNLPGSPALRVRGNDHSPPHFHVEHPDYGALVTIRNPSILAGDMPLAVWKQIWTWTADNQDVLIAEWNRCNPSLKT